LVTQIILTVVWLFLLEELMEITLGDLMCVWWLLVVIVALSFTAVIIDDLFGGGR
jgi:hypothetical protein